MAGNDAIPTTIFTSLCNEHDRNPMKEINQLKNAKCIDSSPSLRNEKFHNQYRTQFRSCIRIRPFLSSDSNSSIANNLKLTPSRTKFNTSRSNKYHEQHKCDDNDWKDSKILEVRRRRRSNNGDENTNGLDYLLLKPQPKLNEAAKIIEMHSSSNNQKQYSNMMGYNKVKNKKSKKQNKIIADISSNPEDASPDEDYSNYDTFPFDTILDENTSQAEVYDQVAKTMVNDLFKNSASCCHHVLMSFGISNSGKTHTLIGNHHCPCPSTPPTLLRTKPKPSTTASTSKSTNGTSITQKTKRKDTIVDSYYDTNVIHSTPTKHNDTFSQKILPQDGILPRIIYDIFSLSQKSKDSSKAKALFYLSIIHIHNDQAIDLLSQNKCSPYSSSQYTSTGSSKPVKVLYNAAKKTFESNPLPKLVECLSFEQTMTSITTALKGIHVKKTNLNTNGSSRGHTMITIKMASNSKKITIVDMAGIERIKKSNVIGSALKESIAINENNTAVLNLLRVLKFNSNKSGQFQLSTDKGEKENVQYFNSRNEDQVKKSNSSDKDTQQSSQPQIVPYRQCTLTMLLQPIFTGWDLKQNDRKKPFHVLKNGNNYNSEISCNNSRPDPTMVVTMLVSVYPGVLDYAEKRALLKQIDALRGLSFDTTATYTTCNPTIYESEHEQYQDSRRQSDTSSLSSASVIVRSGQHNQSPLQAILNQKKHDSPYWKRVAKKSPLRKLSAVVSANTKRLKPTPPKSRTKSQNYDSSSCSLMQNNGKLIQEICQLKDENLRLHERNSELEQTCTRLMIDNDSLRMENRKRKGNVKEERSEMGKKMKYHHPLLPMPLHNHIQETRKCNEMYEVIITGGGELKKPFQLRVPSYWNENKVNDGNTSSPKSEKNESKLTSKSALMTLSNMLEKGTHRG